eukprot:gene7774-8585_t
MSSQTASSAPKTVQSNWLSLKNKLGLSSKPKPKAEEENRSSASATQSLPAEKWKKLMRDRIVALDCEMVGIGLNGKVSALARCSLIDFDGNVLFDEFVQPKGHVTDLRTKWSGIRKRDISSRKAVTLEDCQAEMARLLKGKVLVGHALRNDLTALLLSHPKAMIRDTARYRPYMRQHGSKFRPRALRELTKQYLNKTIQQGEHDSVEDAQCALDLYKLRMEQWEEELREQKKARMAPKAQKGPKLVRGEQGEEEDHSDDKDLEEEEAEETAEGNEEEEKEERGSTGKRKSSASPRSQSRRKRQQR